MLRIGHGFDVHAFAEGRKLILGGIEIPSERGLDNDPAYQGADSIELLRQVGRMAEERRCRILDADCTIAAQAPKLAPYIDQMGDRLAEALGLPAESVGVKATTTEHLGFVGRKEGIAAWAVVLAQDERDAER